VRLGLQASQVFLDDNGLMKMVIVAVVLGLL
jgi:hypothetical protein